MYWLHTDETNLEPNQGTFFIYGGLIATPDQMVGAHTLVQQVRAKYGFTQGDSFKFQTASRPNRISIDDWSAAKAEAIEGAYKLGIKMMAYVVHHQIARNKTKDEKIEFALNALLAHFDLRFLAAKDAYGAVCLDRLPEKFSYPYLEDMFRNGVNVEGRQVALNRVMHYSVTSEGASHINTLVDLTLGGLRYCANACFGNGKPEVAANILPPISKMMWSTTAPDGRLQIRDYGFLAYPKEVRAANLKKDYETLRADLGRFSRDPKSANAV
ncbi:hypothetical protein M1C57_15575 [Rhodococcus pyridinivorans]|uniref:hypothetical protein n=1 Tax=Rhodococcus pyridinivorans TaxID=103816 RepID=UPI00200B9894|nr:hypothetical protein [Rhodococcus pyridinivorans]UPW03090.1 hypothetical protein M1C57_15575 [Rhodococcus pyridinivorans]